MGPLIDNELERVDRKHAQLTQLSSDLVEALNLYHTLMREPGPQSAPSPYHPISKGPPYAYQQPMPHQPPHVSSIFTCLKNHFTSSYLLFGISMCIRCTMAHIMELLDIVCHLNSSACSLHQCQQCLPT